MGVSAPQQDISESIHFCFMEKSRSWLHAVMQLSIDRKAVLFAEDMTIHFRHMLDHPLDGTNPDVVLRRELVRSNVCFHVPVTQEVAPFRTLSAHKACFDGELRPRFMLMSRLARATHLPGYAGTQSRHD